MRSRGSPERARRSRDQQVQRFLSTHDQIANVLSRRRSQDTAARFHSARSQAFTIWAEVTGVAMAA
jgi:putative transposase